MPATILPATARKQVAAIVGADFTTRANWASTHVEVTALPLVSRRRINSAKAALAAAGFTILPMIGGPCPDRRFGAQW